MSRIVQNISWGQIWTFPFHEAIAEWNGNVQIWPNDILLLSHEFRQLIFVLYHDITCVCFRQQDGKNYPMAQIAANHWNHDIIINVGILRQALGSYNASTHYSFYDLAVITCIHVWLYVKVVNFKISCIDGLTHSHTEACCFDHTDPQSTIGGSLGPGRPGQDLPMDHRTSRSRVQGKCTAWTQVVINVVHK